MRRLVLGFAALATITLAIPAAVTSADAKTVIIKEGRGHHHGGWHRHGPSKKVVVIKRRHRY